VQLKIIQRILTVYKLLNEIILYILLPVRVFDVFPILPNVATL